MSEVDFIINVWEGTYRAVLQPGIISEIVAQNRFPFRRVTLLINNVKNAEEAQSLSEYLLRAREIDRFFFVSEYLEMALSSAEILSKDLGRISYYSDWAVVAIFLQGNAPWICHWDAEVQLVEPFDWISPALALMNSDDRIAVANPNWSSATADMEALAKSQDFYLGYGFSDQVFLVRTKEFARPIYRYFAPASLRYPMAHVAPIFEQRVDAYMRINRRLRATHRHAQYVHRNEGKSYPSRSPGESAKRFLIKAALFGMDFLPTNDPKWKVNPAIWTP